MKDKPSFLDIDETALDKALVEQPTLFFKHSRRLADAKMKLDEAEREFDLTKADLSLSIRDFPGKFGLGEKVTEGAIAAATIMQERYQAAQRNVNSCRHAVQLMQGVVTALDHRKRALEKLVDLHGQEYFSSPRVRGEEANASLDQARTRRMIEKTRRKKDDE